ncbi:MAG TPA: DUF58 domain-containing protein [Galbitalea sp.]|jgi:uncharacterized protein (DUF58 family)|nr:DUF58 domain-containing protein [Galbitalea sp.]
MTAITPDTFVGDDAIDTRSPLRRAAAVALAVVRLVWRVVAPRLAVVSTVGWLVLAVAVAALIVSVVLGWQEFFYLGIALVAAVLAAVAFAFGRATYHVEIELTPRRVVAGERALGKMVVVNSGPRRLLPTRMELPVGTGLAEFGIPTLQPSAQQEELFAVPTERRAVILAGPAISVRGDQLGLIRRVIRWTPTTELFVHPVTTHLAPSQAGLVRDLEGQVSRKITDSDISFHALRAYVPGDDRRYVHWRTSARTGQLMVRQFEETRRSQLTILQSTLGSYYADADEFELAVSITASVAAQVIRDGTDMNVVTDTLALRTHSVSAMLDDSCRLQPGRSPFKTAREFARETTKRLPAPSVAMMIAGSRINVADFRSMRTLFPVETVGLAIRVEKGAAPKLGAISGTTIVTVGELSDLSAVLNRAGA